MNHNTVTPLINQNNSHSQSAMDRTIQASWWKRYGKYCLIALGLVLFLFIADRFWPEKGRSLIVSEDRLSISKVSTGQFDDFIPVRGRVTPLRTIYLDTVEGGRVEKVLVEDGVFVKAGDLLVELSNTTLQLDAISREAQVTEQLNNLRTLELDLERNRLQHKRDLIEIDYQLIRLKRLVERRRVQAAKGNVSQAELDNAEDEYLYFQKRHQITIESQETDSRLQEVQMLQLREAGKQLQANLVFARRNLEGLNVRAPVAGKLTALNAELGQSLSQGERLGQIDDPSGYKLSVLIDEFYLGRVDLEQVAELSVKGNKYQLQIVKIYPQVNKGQFEVDLAFINNTPADIRRGQSFQIRLFLGDASEALLIPNGAFYQDTGGQWVFVVSGDSSHAIRRDVRLGRRNQRFIEVLDGLEQGELVITSPYTNYIDMQRLYLGDK
jgi:HlyD family secretion protein